MLSANANKKPAGTALALNFVAEVLHPRARQIKRKKNWRGGEFSHLIGKAGFVYILGNRCFRQDLFKVGASQRGGDDRASELNRRSEMPLPAEFFWCANFTWQIVADWSALFILSCLPWGWAGANGVKNSPKLTRKFWLGS
jgi:hypothetical protein